MRIMGYLTIISTGLLAAGCADQPPRSTYGTYGYTEAPLSSQRYNQETADRSLEASVREQLNRYGDLGTSSRNVQILARNGAVTLAGTVASERERGMIEACVKNSSGVVSVNDQLHVGYAPTGGYTQPTTVYEPAPAAPVMTTPPPRYAQTINPEIVATTETDSDLANRVADSIRSDPVLPTLAPSVSVHVTGGRVLLRGTVESHKQKHAIVDAVKRTPGVLDVRDELKVR